jgi:anaerobic magnesium-protoporphyrin IX monomethyl ester cyclase
MAKVLVIIPPSKHSRNVARDLLYGCWCKGKRIGGIQFPPLTLLLVATVLRDDGHKVRLFDASLSDNGMEELRNIAKGYDAAVILTSSMTVNEDAGVLQELKNVNNNLKTIVFGSAPTFVPRFTLEKGGIDAAVRGEAEFIIRDIARSLGRGDESWKKVDGISFLHDGAFRSNPAYPFIENLDELPIPDRTMLDPDIHYFNPIIKRMPYTTMYTARGCPGECTFCSSPSFYGKRIRYRSAAGVLKELEAVAAQGYREVFFRDEIFTVSRKRTREICEGIIERKLDITWIASARIGSVDKEMLKLMKKAGCHLVRFGVESGVQQILDNIKKGINVSQIKDTFKWIHEVGLDTHAHFMIGMPGDTAETVKSTIRFAREIDPTVVTFGVTTAYPGTELFNMVSEKHPEIKDGSTCDLSRLHTKGFYNEAFTSMSERELSAAVRTAYKKFYMRPGYITRRILGIRSGDELKRVMLAGTRVFDFVLRGD